MIVLTALVGLLTAPVGARAEWAPLGETPATGQGVFRFPQALAYAPGGSGVFVGDQFSGVVQRFARDGTWEADLGWYADDRELGRLGVLGGLATDRDGHLYVLDSENDRVQVFDADSGAWLAAWGTRGTAPGEFRLGRNTGAGGIAVEQPAAGAPVVVYIADQNNHRIQAFALDQSASSGENVLPPGARNPEQSDVVPVPEPARSWGRFGSCAATGCGADADREVLDHPQGVAVDPRTGNVFVADDRNHRVVEYRPDGTYLRQVGSYGYGAGQFRFPYDVGIDAREPRQLYVADNNNHRVQAFDVATLAFVTTWGVFGSQPGNFEYPRALAAVADDPAGGVAVADTANNRTQVFAPDGHLLAQWGIAGRGPGYVTRPRGVAIDATGRVHVADTLANRVERLAADGAYLGQTGYISPRSGFAAPASGDGQFNLPHGIAADRARDRIWVADTHNDRVQELSSDGTWIATHVGLGFRQPRAIAVAPDGAVLVADSGNDRIQRHDPNAGTWSVVDTDTPLNNPAGVAGGADGAVYVAEPNADRVLRITGGRTQPLPGSWNGPSGLALHESELYVADTNASRVLRQDVATGGREILGTEGRDIGRFVAPAGVAVDESGSVLVVADTGNDRLQRLQLRGVPPAATRRLDVAVSGLGTVRSDPNGITCGTDCRQSFSHESAVTLTAVAEAGAVFVGWDGACAGAGPCRLTMGDAARVGARFAAAPEAAAPPPAAPPPLVVPPAATGPVPPERADRKPPRLHSVRLSPTRLRPARRGDLISRRRLSRGANLRLVLSEPATVAIAVDQRRRAARLTLPRGSSRLWMSGRVNGRALRRGRHRLVIQAVDAAGNRSRTLRIAFRIR